MQEHRTAEILDLFLTFRFCYVKVFSPFQCMVKMLEYKQCTQLGCVLLGSVHDIALFGIIFLHIYKYGCFKGHSYSFHPSGSIVSLHAPGRYHARR